MAISGFPTFLGFTGQIYLAGALVLGLITLGDLRGEWSGAVGSYEAADEFDRLDRRPRWSFEVRTSEMNHVALTIAKAV